MTRGTWFAFAKRDRLLALDALSRRLSADPSLAVRQDSNLLVVTVRDSLTGRSADVTAAIDCGAHVATEAAALAQQLTSGDVPLDAGVPPPDRESLAGAACRYELSWELRFSDETYNAMVTIASVLEQESGAIIYDATNRRFV